MSNDRDYKIEKINAYRKLLDVTLKSATKSEELQKEIQQEFRAFLEGKLNELMGVEDEDKLSSDEIAVLKMLVANAQKRATTAISAPKAEIEALNKSSGTTEVKEDAKREPAAYVPRNLQPPLGNRKIEGSTKKQANQNNSILDQLDQMDKKYENEW